MVQLTSAEAAKILKKLNEELSSVMRKEQYDRSMIMRIQARRLTKSKRRFGY